MIAHGQGVALLLNLTFIFHCVTICRADVPLIKGWLTVMNVRSFRTLVSLRSPVSMPERGGRALLLTHAS